MDDRTHVHNSSARSHTTSGLIDVGRALLQYFFGCTVMELPEFQLYIGSLYWSVMTVSTIGYGDIVPDTSLERTFVILAMLIGAFAYGYIIGAVSTPNLLQTAGSGLINVTFLNTTFLLLISRAPIEIIRTEHAHIKWICHSSDISGMIVQRAMKSDGSYIGMNHEKQG
eukprot:scaffold13534_cov27-Prasinocladus_malaysianus.AAC.1